MTYKGKRRYNVGDLVEWRPSSPRNKASIIIEIKTEPHGETYITISDPNGTTIQYDERTFYTNYKRIE